MENSIRFHLDSNRVIAATFCTWHDSCRGMCKNLLRSNGQQRHYSKANFPSNLNCGQNTVSKTGPWPCLWDDFGHLLISASNILHSLNGNCQLSRNHRSIADANRLCPINALLTFANACPLHFTPGNLQTMRKHIWNKILGFTTRVIVSFPRL